MAGVENDYLARPRIRPTVEWVELPDDSLLLVRPAGRDVRIHAPDLALLGSLDGSRTVAELEQRFEPTALRETLASMRGLGLLEDASEDDLLDPGVRTRFEGQLRYFGEVGGPGGPTPVECQRRLAGASVVVLGVGGLGGRVALDLASVGVGELRLADGDRVEPGNLNRQIQFEEADVGRPKVTRAAARIRALHPATTVRTRMEFLETEEEIAAFVAGADVVVAAADQPPHLIERRLNAACFRLGVPWIAMSHFPPLLRAGPLYVPGETGCHACMEAAVRREHPHYDAAVAPRRDTPPPGPTLGPACGLTAGLVADDVVNLLTGVIRPRTLGAGHTFDLRTGELRRHEILAEPDCPVCGDGSGGPRAQGAVG